MKEEALTIVIPYLPKSLNTIIRMKRPQMCRYFGQCKHDAFFLTKEQRRQKIPYQKALMTITFVVPDKRARDRDNLIGGAKGMIDGIKKAGIFEDDSWQCLEMKFKVRIGKKAETIFEIEEIL